MSKLSKIREACKINGMVWYMPNLHTALGQHGNAYLLLTALIGWCDDDGVYKAKTLDDILEKLRWSKKTLRTARQHLGTFLEMGTPISQEHFVSFYKNSEGLEWRLNLNLILEVINKDVEEIKSTTVVEEVEDDVPKVKVKRKRSNNIDRDWLPIPEHFEEGTLNDPYSFKLETRHWITKFLIENGYTRALRYSIGYPSSSRDMTPPPSKLDYDLLIHFAIKAIVEYEQVHPKVAEDEKYMKEVATKLLKELAQEINDSDKTIPVGKKAVNICGKFRTFVKNHYKWNPNSRFTAKVKYSNYPRGYNCFPEGDFKIIESQFTERALKGMKLLKEDRDYSEYYADIPLEFLKLYDAVDEAKEAELRSIKTDGEPMAPLQK